MSTRRIREALFAVAVLAVAMAAPASTAPLTDTPGTPPALMNECNSGPLIAEPGRVVFFCGDGNGYVSDMVWGLWSADRAMGVGTQRRNECVPACYNSTRWSSVPAVVYLDQPLPVANTSATRFSHATVVTTSGSTSYRV